MYLRVNIEAMSDSVLVPVVRRMASGVLKELGADEKTLDKVMLVVTEACSNAVRHAYDALSMYEVTLEYSPEVMHISVRDYGKGFDPKAVQGPGTDTLRPGGYGIRLMNEESSKFVLESAPGKGTLLEADIPIEYRSKRFRLKLVELPDL